MMPRKTKDCTHPHTAWPWGCDCPPPYIPLRAHRVYEEADEDLRKALKTFYDAKYVGLKVRSGATKSFPVDLLRVFDQSVSSLYEVYAKNLLAFYRLLDSGAFAGHEDQWVVIEDEKIKAFYDKEPNSDTISGLIKPVDDRNTPISRK